MNRKTTESDDPPRHPGAKPPERAETDTSETEDLTTINRRLQQEIAERKRAEETLRDSEERLRTVISASKDAMIAIDENGLTTLFNPAAEAMFGRSADEMLGRPLDCLMPKEYRRLHQRYVREYFLHGKPGRTMGQTVELPAVRSNGQQFPMELSLSAGRRGDHRFALAIIRDITERTRAAQELERSKEAAEAASRAKSIFLANLSHEIRTPIMAMLGAAEMAGQSEGSRTREPYHRDIILRTGQHLLSLVENLLDVARLEAGKLDVHPIDCSLLEIIADVRAVVEPLHYSDQTELRILYDSSIPHQIHTDPIRLKEAIINLVNNALKFTKAGHVHVRVDVDRRADDPRLTIAVQDTGLGIPATELRRIFDVYAQVKSTAPLASGGVGLGLPLSRHIAEKLGGSLQVRSREGHGSTFTLHIATGPLDKAEWITPRQIEISPHSPAPETTTKDSPKLEGYVLLAEDFADARQVIKHALTDAGAKVTAVSNGEEAIRAAVRTPFDLIVMDVRMPVTDGLTAAAELRRRGYLTPMVALTASTGENERLRILDTGFDAVWTKPMSLQDVVERAGAYLSSPSTEPETKNAGRSEARRQSFVAEFARGLPDRFRAIQEAMENGDHQAGGELLHQLAGAGGILGFMPLSEESARLLARIDEGAFGDCADELRPLRTLIDRITRSTPEHQTIPSVPDGGNPSTP